MRKRVVFSVFGLAVLLLSCHKQAESEFPQPGRLVTLMATCVESESRVVLSSISGETIWNKGDSVSVFRGGFPKNIGARFTGNTGAKVGSITFQDISSIGSSETVETVAAVPYRVENRLSGHTLHSVIPTEQVYREESYAPKSVLLTAVTLDDKLKFRYACAVLCLEVKPNNDVSIQSVKLSSAAGEKIAGAVAVNLQKPNQPVVTVAEDGSNSIVLKNADDSPVSINSGEKKKFYFCVAPVALSEGYIVEVALSETEVLSFRNTAVRGLEAGTLSGIQCGISSQSVSIIIDFDTDFTPELPDQITRPQTDGDTYFFKNAASSGEEYSITSYSKYYLTEVNGHKCFRFNDVGSCLLLPSIHDKRLRSMKARIMTISSYKEMSISSKKNSDDGYVVSRTKFYNNAWTSSDANEEVKENTPLYLYTHGNNTQIESIELYFE